MNAPRHRDEAVARPRGLTAAREVPAAGQVAQPAQFAVTPFTRATRLARFDDLLRERIIVMDGAMGTLIQSYELVEAEYRSRRFANHPRDLRGDSEVLSLVRPDILLAIHDAYLDAGADIIETNTFTANRIAQADYGLVEVVREMNHEAARLARQAADLAEAREPGRPRYVLGALGPTNRTASISPDAGDPGARTVTFDELAVAYQESAEGLIVGGADLLVIETIFDTLNAKAAIFGVEAAYDALGDRIPLIISGTITDASGRTLSGQTVEAFWTSVMHARPIAVGLNCALGARQLRGHIADLVAPISNAQTGLGLDDATAAELDRLQETELEVARTDFACAEQLDRTIEGVRSELEAELIEENGERIAAYAATYESSIADYLHLLDE